MKKMSNCSNSNVLMINEISKIKTKISDIKV